MRASWPAAGTALAVTQVRAAPIDPLLPRLGLLGGLDPANPLVAGERGDVVPGQQRIWVAFERIFEIVGEVMDYTAGDVVLGSHRQDGAGRRGAIPVTLSPLA